MTTTPFLAAAPVQQQMWLVDRMDPQAAIYNEDIAFWIDGDLRPEALETAWRTLAERHEALRYVFAVDDDSGQLRLRTLPEHDLSWLRLATTRRGTDAEALAWGRDLVQEVYDLTGQPPVRIGLAQVAADRWLMVVGFHHAVIDVGSIGLLWEELAEAYAAHLAGREPRLEPVGRTYLDFAAWAGGEEYERLVDKSLPDVVARLKENGARSAELPPDRPRPAVKSTRGRVAEAAFPAGIVPRIREFSARHRVTPFQVLLGGMTALLHRCTRLDEMVFGIGSSGRPAGYEKAVGPFACFVPVRAAAPGAAAFTGLLDEARRITREAAGAQFVPFSRVVSEVAGGRDASRSPVVQIVFNAPPLRFRSDVLTGCALHQARLPRTRSRVDLLVNVEWLGDDLAATAEFDAEVYDEDTVVTFLGQLGVVIDEALLHPGLPVDELPIPWPAAPVRTEVGGASRPDDAGSDAAWCRLDGDGFVTAVSAPPRVREPNGQEAPAGIEGELFAGDVPVPGMRARRLADGRLRGRRLDAGADARTAARGAAPRGSRVERHVVELCRRLLENPHAAPGDDFFVAGGHSMLAARLVQRLGDEFGVEVPLLMVFEHPVLTEFAAELEAQFPAVAQTLAQLDELSESELARLYEEYGDEDGPGADIEAVTGLSGHEQPFWLMEQFAPKSSVNTLTLRIRGSGPLDIDALEYAFGRVLERQEILRTSYGADAAMNAVRHVHPEAPLRIAVHHTDAAGADRLAHQEATTGFDISAPPLLRAVVVHTGDGRFELLLSCHHLVMDYWGVTRVMLPEVAAYYRERVAGVPPEPAPAEGYRHAILREAAWRESPQAAAEADYWREQLRDMRAAEFRTDRPRRADTGFAGAVATASVGADVTGAVEAYLKERRTTLFVVVAAAVAATARTWSGTDDVSFMTPSENRVHEADARVMGTFVNLVTMRYHIPPELTWDELMAQSRRRTLDAYANQSVPISAALAAVGKQHVIASGQGRYLVLNVFTDRTGLELEGCRVDGGSIVQHDSATTDLELSVMHTGGRLELVMKYRPELWEPDTVQRMLGDVTGALRHLVADGSAAVAAARP